MLLLQEILVAWIYFFSFIIIYSITMLNLLIAVLVDVVINQIFDLLINIMETPKIIIDPPI